MERYQDLTDLRMAVKRYPNRKSIRLPEYDYTEPGGYFITINCHRGRKLFGEVVGERVELNATGQTARDCWSSIPDHFDSVRLDAFIVMPSHVHGILFIEDTLDMRVRAQHAAPVRPSNLEVKPGSLGAIVRSYKAAVTRAVNLSRGSAGSPLWHRNYYERVIRDEKELESIRNYITFNYLKPLSYRDQP